MGEKNIVVQPAGRTEDPGARLWQIWLAVLLLGGTLLSFWDSWVDLGIAPILPACLGTAALALSMAAGWLRERDRRLSMLQILSALPHSRSKPEYRAIGCVQWPRLRIADMDCD